MPIPNYQLVMLPLLKALDDREEHPLGELVDYLASQFELTREEKLELLPSGKMTRFRSRVGWARTYLSKAGLLENEGRGAYKITERGLRILERNPPTIDNQLLREFPEFVEWVDAYYKQDDVPVQEIHSSPPADRTPDEALVEAYSKIRGNVAGELLDNVKRMSPSFFERLVVDLLLKMGYGGSFQETASQLTPATADEGIDGIINEDRLGLDVIYVQAKRWEGNVSRPEIQKFAGALQGKRAKKGVFITTSDFSKEAREYISLIDTRIVLIGGKDLADFMLDYNVGVSVSANYEIKKIDSDYFVEE